MADETTAPILTIGHSNHGIDAFVALARGAGVAAVIDVRSIPYSRRLPHFSRPALARALADAGIGYRHLGEALGGKPPDDAAGDGARRYERIAAAPSFTTALDLVEAEAARATVALMCAEREPLECHRVVLVARHLARRGAALAHVHADGRVEPHAALEERLLAWHRRRAGGAPAAQSDLFAPTAEARGGAIDAAYDARARWMLGG